MFRKASLIMALAMGIGMNAFSEDKELFQAGADPMKEFNVYPASVKSELVKEDGRDILKFIGPCTVAGKTAIPVDPAKTYILKGKFKSIGKVPSIIFFGLLPCDTEKKQIAAEAVNACPDTNTELAVACSAKDSSLKVKDAGKWMKRKGLDIYGYVAFNIDDSGALKDLPNRALSPVVKEVRKAGDQWELILAAPYSGKDMAAGTKVRLHHPGNSYIYCAANYKTVPTEWTSFEGKITGMGAKASDIEFWSGTAFVKLLILGNFNQKEESAILIDGLLFVEAGGNAVK